MGSVVRVDGGKIAAVRKYHSDDRCDFRFRLAVSSLQHKATYLPDFVYSGRLELIVWAIPLLTIMLLGGVIWIGSHDLDPAKPLASKTPPLEIQVVSLDWKWLFIYPNRRVASVNQLVVPAGVPIHFSLMPASVMNAFFIPQLGSMIYTMNGMTTQLNLRANAPGTFRGLSSHYRGDGFSDVHFDVQAVPSSDACIDNVPLDWCVTYLDPRPPTQVYLPGKQERSKTTASEVKTRIGAAPNVIWRQVDFQATPYSSG
jgi:hypothetical protein